MEALFLTKKEAVIINNALSAYAVDLMREINNTKILYDEEKGSEVRDTLYDIVDDLDALQDRLSKYW